VTGFTWPPAIWSGGGTMQALADTAVSPSTVSQYTLNRIDTVTGHGGNATRALYSEIARKGGDSTQDPFVLLPASEGGDLYIRYWMKFQPDMVQQMGVNGWRAFFEWKTDGDYRVAAYVYTDGSGQPYWFIHGDNNANGGLPYQEFWAIDNRSVPVPAGQWFKFEVFWHRSGGSDGRVWEAINGHLVADHRGPNMGVDQAPINRIMVFQNYTGTTAMSYEWADDLEIWNGFPADATSH
jgi:hypothetical protein